MSMSIHSCQSNSFHVPLSACRKQAYEFCHCWLHLIKLFFRTSIAISDSRGELPDPPLDLRVELVVDHGVQAAPVLALDTLAQHPGSYVSKLSLVRRALRLNHQSPAVFLHHQSVTVVSFAWPLPRLSKESFNIFTRRSLCQAACFAKLWTSTYVCPKINKIIR